MELYWCQAGFTRTRYDFACVCGSWSRLPCYVADCLCSRTMSQCLSAKTCGCIDIFSGLRQLTILLKMLCFCPSHPIRINNSTHPIQTLTRRLESTEVTISHSRNNLSRRQRCLEDLDSWPAIFLNFSSNGLATLSSERSLISIMAARCYYCGVPASLEFCLAIVQDEPRVMVCHRCYGTWEMDRRDDRDHEDRDHNDHDDHQHTTKPWKTKMTKGKTEKPSKTKTTKGKTTVTKTK